MTAADVCKECGYIGESMVSRKEYKIYRCANCNNIWFGFPKIVEGQETEVVL